MSRGRKATPHHLKLVTGNPGKRSLQAAPLDVPTATLPAPDHLGDDARALWNALMPDLVRLKLLTKFDAAAFEQYCWAYGAWRAATRKLTELGANTYETHGRNGKMFRVRPEVTIAGEMIRTGRSIGSEFGLSPVARERLKNFGQSDLFDPFAEWMNASA